MTTQTFTHVETAPAPCVKFFCEHCKRNTDQIRKAKPIGFWGVLAHLFFLFPIAFFASLACYDKAFIGLLMPATLIALFYLNALKRGIKRRRTLHTQCLECGKYND